MILRFLLVPTMVILSSPVIKRYTEKNCPESCCYSSSPIFQIEEDKCVLTKGNQRLTTTLVQEMGSLDSNVFISPHSLMNILRLLLLAANGETKAELEQALVSHSIDIHSAAKCVSDAVDKSQRRNLNRTNDFFISSEYKGAYTEYAAQAKQFYRADFFLCNFLQRPEKGRRRINKIVGVKTRGMITDLFPEGEVTTETKLVVVNTITFKDHWKHQFDKSLTYSGPFFSGPTKRKTTTFMKISANFSSSWFPVPGPEDTPLNVIALDMPYTSEEYSFLAVKYTLHDQLYSSLSHIENFISDQGILSVRAMLQEGPLSLDFPRFRMEYNKDLRDILTPQTQLSHILSPRADFSNFAGPELPLVVSNIYHKAVIEVTEEGTVSTGATGGSWMERFADNVAFNTPFVFYIYHNCDGLVLFQGRYVYPE